MSDSHYPAEFLRVQQLLNPETAKYFSDFIKKHHFDLLGRGGAYTCEQHPSNFKRFNWLRTHLADWLVPGIQDTLDTLGRPRGFWSACWATIYEKGMGITSHSHAFIEDYDNPRRNFICGTLFLDGPPNIGTLYGLGGPGQPWHHQINTPGECVWFPNYLIHAAKQNPYDYPRTVISFDIYPDDVDPPSDPNNPTRFRYHEPNSSSYYDPDEDPEFGMCPQQNWFGEQSHPDWLQYTEANNIYPGPLTRDGAEPDTRTWEQFVKDENLDIRPLAPRLEEGEDVRHV